ncbi:MAG: hypothetical protein ACREJ3_06585, partial [Polyangiaceae bacterium]
GYSAGNGCAPDGGVGCSSCSSFGGGGVWSACGSSCVELATDPNNCGACGTHCTFGQQCTAGVCGSECPGSEVCTSGACVAVCPSGTMECTSPGSNATGTCTSIQNDPNNCGACGAVCPQGQGCDKGTCASMCGVLDAGSGAGGGVDASAGGG